jgi:hypothetical protein
MRVVTWNMGLAPGGKGSPATHDQAWHFLLGLGPDLAFIQEALPPQWVRGHGELVHGPIKKWGSAIFSPRYPLERRSPPLSSNLHALGAYLALGVASLPDGVEAFIASVHARHGNATADQLAGLDPTFVRRPSLKKPHVNDVVFAGLTGIVSEQFIVAGDWNTARMQGSKSAGTEFFDRVTKAGWFDCVRRKNQGREIQTWFGPTRSLKQDDHVFCDKRLGTKMKRRPWAAAEAATHLNLSDHAPLVLDFDVEPIGMTSLTRT